MQAVVETIISLNISWNKSYSFHENSFHGRVCGRFRGAISTEHYLYLGKMMIASTMRVRIRGSCRGIRGDSVEDAKDSMEVGRKVRWTLPWELSWKFWKLP